MECLLYHFHFNIRKSDLHFMYKTERKVIPAASPKDMGAGTKGMASLIFSLSTWWGWAVSLKPRHFATRKETSVSSEEEDGWASELLWIFGSTEKSFVAANSQTPAHPILTSHYTNWAIPAPSFHVSVIAFNKEFKCRTYPVVFQVVLLKTNRKWNSNREINKDPKHLIGQGSWIAKCQIVWYLVNCWNQ